MAAVNLALRFLVEVLGIAALAYAGFQIPNGAITKMAAGFGAPFVLVVVWAVVVAPKAVNGLSQAQKDLIGTVLLLLAAAALASAGRQALAVGFAAVVLANAVLLVAFASTAPVVEAATR